MHDWASGASPPSRTSGTEMFIFIYIRLSDRLMREVYVKWFKGHHNRLNYIESVSQFYNGIVHKRVCTSPA